LRVQIHKNADQVSLFSRNLESMTEMFPELVAAAAKLKVKNVILDGEAIAYKPGVRGVTSPSRRRPRAGAKRTSRSLPPERRCEPSFST